MNKTLLSIAVAGALACGFAAPANAMSKAEYKAADDRISHDYDAARDACGKYSGNAKDICISQAKGNEKIARADLEVAYQDTEKNRYDARLARADAAFDTAKERCDDFAGNAKDVCRKDADANHTRAVADAKLNRTANEAQMRADTKMADARADANKDVRDADYKAARERCDSLAGATKDRCVADAKARFGM